MICFEVSFFTILLIESLPLSDARYFPHDFHSTEKNPSFLTPKEIENLKQILNYIRDAPEFCPLTLSIIVPEFHSNVLDFLSMYMSRNSIKSYVTRVNDLSLKGTWKSQIHLTWIIFVDDVSTLNLFIYWQQELWKATNQYLIVFTKQNVTIPWREIFEDLWRMYDVYRVLIASVQDDFQCLVKYLPFDLHRGRFGGIHRVCLKDSFNDSTQQVSFKEEQSKTFIDKSVRLFEKFQDLKNHYIDVIVFNSLMMNVSHENNKMKLSKLDADVMGSLEKLMKVKFRVKVLKKSELNGEDPFDVALKYIESGKVEMIITGFFTKNYDNYRKYEFTSTVYEDRLCFIAPSSGLVPKFYMPFLPFEKHLWALLFLYNIAITFLWFLVKYLSKSFRDKSQILVPLATSSWLEKAHGIVANYSRDVSKEERSPSSSRLSSSKSLEAPRKYEDRNVTLIKTKPRNPPSNEPPEIHPYVLTFSNFAETFCYPLQAADTAAQKAFLFGTLFFGLIVTGLYQSYLVSSLSKPLHYPELKTVEDVVNSDKSVITKYSNLKRTFVDDTPLGKRLDRKIQVVNSSIPTNDMVAYKKMIAIARYASVKLENLSIYYDKEGNKLLHIVDECPAVYMLSYVMRLYSPYRERVNMILLSMQEAGFVKFWYEKMIYPVEVDEYRRKVAMSERKIKLTLEHYSLTFLLLFVGLFGSALVFLAEMYYAKRLAS